MPTFWTSDACSNREIIKLQGCLLRFILPGFWMPLDSPTWIWGDIIGITKLTFIGPSKNKETIELHNYGRSTWGRRWQTSLLSGEACCVKKASSVHCCGCCHMFSFLGMLFTEQRALPLLCHILGRASSVVF